MFSRPQATAAMFHRWGSDPPRALEYSASARANQPPAFGVMRAG